MNQKELMLQRNKSACLLEITSRAHRNCVRINSNNSLEHEQAKLAVCMLLKQHEIEFVTEAEFKNGKRADILVLDHCLAIEILHSEPMLNIVKKRSEYPVDVLPVTTEEVARGNFNNFYFL